MIDTVPIDPSIALANDDAAAGSSVTSPPNLRAYAAQRHASLIAGTGHRWVMGSVRVLVVRHTPGVPLMSSRCPPTVSAIIPLRRLGSLPN
jgi:hypothetical protein